MRIGIFAILPLIFCGRTDLPYSTKTVFAENESAKRISNWSTEDLFRSSNGRVRTNAILVLYRGRIVLEVYASEFDENSLQPTWSISKFLLNGVVGRAVVQGKIDLDHPVRDYLIRSGNSLPKELKVKDLLFFSSGIDWKESYELNPFDSDVLEILYGHGNSDMARYISEKSFSGKPGEKVSYSSGDSNLLSAVAAARLGKNFPEEFFRSIGIRSFVWETDGQGTPVASSYAYLSARDLAKIGEFYIREGWENSSRTLPKDWIKTTFKKLNSEKPLPWYFSSLPFPSMGGHVYLNRKKGSDSEILFRALSDDSFFASGHWGQYLIVDPKKDLVVVRLGNDRLGRFPIREFLERLLPILESASDVKSQ